MSLFVVRQIINRIFNGTAEAIRIIPVDSSGNELSPVGTNNGALEATQLDNKAELEGINSELDVHTNSLNAIALALDADLSTRASETTLVGVETATESSATSLSSIDGKISNNSTDEVIVSDELGFDLSAGIVVGTSAVELIAGASTLTGRKYITVQNFGPGTIYVSENSGVTTSGSTIGRKLFPEQSLFRSVKAQTLYVISDTASTNVFVSEHRNV